MRIPIPTNRLVALTLVGALLTGIVSLGLASPSLLTGSNAADDALGAGAQPGGSGQLAGDAPTPNPDFTPAVQTATGYEDDEHERFEDDDHDEYEGDDEEYEGDDDEYEDDGEHEEYDD